MKPNSTAAATAIQALKERFEKCKQEISELQWLSEGSVAENYPGTWRWTRKVKAKTVSVALSTAQAEAFLLAIANHRKLEDLILEMRAISQTVLLNSIPGPKRRGSKNIPNLP